MTDFMPPCPNECGSMHPDYENNGFEPPEGAPHYELIGYYCPICGAKTTVDEAYELELEEERQDE
jgi:hypothetical protein